MTDEQYLKISKILQQIEKHAREALGKCNGANVQNASNKCQSQHDRHQKTIDDLENLEAAFAAENSKS